MDTGRKCRGSIKAKLGLPFYKAAKLPASGAQHSSKVMPRQSSPLAATAKVAFMVHQDMISQPKAQKVSFIVPNKGRDSLGQFDMVFGMPGDETVDLKATNYISSVRERFKLERVNSERKKNEVIS
ncbi:uncharacterized protein LOC104419130 [Eucalyptus grandis]|uniref:Uncharacterized protein n=2 Tax=Eucalyptus grandis TaxID=71139 RepID=A0ACC3JHM4_EUCGR|nr:uncharacterized protein LOC104419130 [Eucalyptus grandis]KAK3412990.1 hypothetical protein EUGRSUZ_I01635 [Eucalyptus grandis]